MREHVLKSVALGIVFTSYCVLATAQSSGDGSVLIHNGNGSTGVEDGGVRVSAGVMAGLNTFKPDPDPLIARRMHLSGAVVLAVRIDPEGNVVKVTPVSGPEPLRDPAMAAVRRWTYKPYLLNGKPVVVSTTVTVMFYPGR